MRQMSPLPSHAALRQQQKDDHRRRVALIEHLVAEHEAGDAYGFAELRILKVHHAGAHTAAGYGLGKAAAGSPRHVHDASAAWDG